MHLFQEKKYATQPKLHNLLSADATLILHHRMHSGNGRCLFKVVLL